MKIYISGKITGLPLEEAQANFQAAEYCLLNENKEFSPEVINPMKLPHNHGQTWEEYMRDDIYALLSCDGIYMLPDWQQSKGARLEYAIAKELNLTISYEPTGINQGHTPGA